MKHDNTTPVDDLLQQLKQAQQHERAATHNEQLAERILAALPDEQNVVKLPARPTRRRALFSGLALAASVIAVSVLLVLQQSPTPGTGDAFEQWAWEEVFDESPASALEQDEQLMLALLAPELASEFYSDEF